MKSRMTGVANCCFHKLCFDQSWYALVVVPLVWFFGFDVVFICVCFCVLTFMHETRWLILVYGFSRGACGIITFCSWITYLKQIICCVSCSDGVSIASSSTCFSRHSAMDEVYDKMKDLSHGRGDHKRKSKRDKIAQRSAFRDICSFVEVAEHYSLQINMGFSYLRLLPETSRKRKICLFVGNAISTQTFVLCWTHSEH